MAPGTIILLNGTGSAGKTTLARAIQAVFAVPYLHLGIDTFVGEVSPPWGAETADFVFTFVPVPDTDPLQVEWRVGPFGHFLVAGLHQAVAALAIMGHNVVVDHCLHDPRWLADCVDRWRDLPVCFVGVRCSPEVLAERLAARTDRTPIAKGVPLWQWHWVHRHAVYDLEVDTSRRSPTDCAREIEQWLQTGAPPTAFAHLAAIADGR